MSSISNNDNSMTSSNYLILDFGLYPSSKEHIKSLKDDNENQIIELKPNLMKNSDWDHVLDLIIKNKKCITL